MRSPPMVNAVPVISHERARQDKISKFDSLELPPDTPNYVFDDIVKYDPKTSYLSLHAERDRRLRLLVRRYINQIQYGCKNHNCVVPTCLSYRKRNAKVPLRRYTELSARTLACRLVEEYAQQGKEQTSGLCTNEPLVPWYEDPSSARRRRSTVDRLNEKEPQYRANGHAPEDCPRRRKRQSNNRSSATEGQSGTTVESKPRSDIGVTPGDVAADPLRLVAIDDEKTETLVGYVAQDLSSTIGDGNHGIHTSSEPALAAPPASVIDFASFTQRIWDMLPLRRLEWSSASSPSGESDEQIAQDVPALKDVESCQHPELKTAEGARIPMGNTGTNFCGFTLRRLSWDTLSFLVTDQAESKEPWRAPFEKFLQQSLFHTLSHPIRLLKCARSWGEGTEIAPYSPTELRLTVNDSLGLIWGDEGKGDQSSARHRGSAIEKDRKGKIDASRIMFAFSMMSQIRTTSEVYDALHVALQQCYDLELKSPSLASSFEEHGMAKQNQSLERAAGLPDSTRVEMMSKALALSDEQAIDIFLVVLLAASTSFWSDYLPSIGPDNDRLEYLSDNRDGRRAYPAADFASGYSRDKNMLEINALGWLIDSVDVCEDWHLVRLLTSLMDNISHRTAAQAMSKITKRGPSRIHGSKSVVDSLVQKLCNWALISASVKKDYHQVLSRCIIELSRTVLLKIWDRAAIVRRTSPVGGALELLSGLYRRRTDFGIEPPTFVMKFIAEAFDELEMPSHWLSFRPDGRYMHILSFSFLFEPATLVKYFRAVNIETMRKSHETASIVFSDARQFLGSITIPVYGAKEVLAEMRAHMAKYFVLTIRRTSVLTDALNQIWRRQRQELMRPLRVRLGKDEGEDGLDHGGVQQEFFRLALAEALQPDYGMFVVDERTRMTWFQPGSLEPLYKFEALGILMSLAIYNAVTLPITFPLAFYRKLLDLKVKKLQHIADGWPDLTKGLQFLLDWSDGDVGEVIARTYEFSYGFLGTIVTVDMQKVGKDEPWPPTERISRKGKEKAKSTTFELPVPLDITPPSHSPPTLSPGSLRSTSRTSSFRGISTPVSVESELLDEVATVTNANREKYIKDYIFWLTDKSIRSQYEAFAKGFFTCLDPAALTLFTPEALKDVVEGHREIDIEELENTATYEEYEASSQTVIDFWNVVRDFSPEQHRQLLEFVTASDRIPVNGMGSIQFIIQKNGDDDTRLPSSSTCYGRLLLPQYSSKAILKEKLAKAIEHSMGFGAL